MAGPAKKRGQKEKQTQQQAGSSQDSSASRDPTQRSINKLDGNKDPQGHGAGVMEYTKEGDLKNLSEFLGISGWYTARGVSANTLLPKPMYACIANVCMSCTIHTLVHLTPSSVCTFSMPFLVSAIPLSHLTHTSIHFETSPRSPGIFTH